MKKTLLFILPLAAMLLVALSSCNKSDKDEDEYRGNGGNPAVQDSYMLVCQHVCDVNKEVKKYFKTSKNITQLNKYAEDIKKLKYVEDVYSTNNTMYVQVKDFGTISYSYFEADDAPNKYNIQMMMHQARKAASNNEDHPLLGLENAVIINQASNDESRRYAVDISNETVKLLERCGIKAKIINNPKKEVFRDSIFKYDIVFLITHGSWNPKEELHWFVTSEVPSAKEVSDFNADDLYEYKNIPRDQVSITTINETRNGQTVDVSYIVVSEKYIGKSDFSYKKEGKTIFFNAACQSMAGGYRFTRDENGVAVYSDNNEVNNSFAKILKEKGLGVYFGYDETNNVGHRGGMVFLGYLACGMSISNAYKSLPNYLLHNDNSDDTEVEGRQYHMEWTADLVADYSKKFADINKSCISRSSLSEIDDKSTDYSLKYILEATSPAYLKISKSYNSNISEWYEKDVSSTPFRYGFELSESENFSNPKQLNEMSIGDANCTLSNNKVTFTKTLTSSDLKPSTTYYYKAFFSDGVDTYYTAPKKFTTNKVKSDGKTDLPDVPGSDF